MRRREYIDLIIDSISDSFDIYHNYWFKDRKIVVYAYNYNYKDKFESAENAKLWESKSYEHLFFINNEELTADGFNELYQWVIENVEPHFVRGDKKLPQKGHQSSYITLIIITKYPITYDVATLIKKSNYHKDYMFGARGFLDVRIAVITPSTNEITVNKRGGKIAKFLEDLLPI